MPLALYSYWVAVKDFSLSGELVLTWNNSCHCDKFFVSCVLSCAVVSDFLKRINQSEHDHCTFP